MHRRNFLKIAALTARHPSRGRTQQFSTRSAYRQALLREAATVAARASRPVVIQTPELLANCGVVKQQNAKSPKIRLHRPESPNNCGPKEQHDECYYGQAVFGGVGQFSSGRNVEYALDGLAHGFTGSVEEGRRFMTKASGMIESLVRNTSLRDWWLLGFTTPVTLSMKMSTTKFELTRRLDLQGSPQRVPERRTSTMILGEGISPVRLELPAASVIDLHRAGHNRRGTRPTLIRYTSATQLTVHSGRCDQDVAEAVGLLGPEATRLHRPIRTDYYEKVSLPGDDSEQAAQECMLATPNMPKVKTLALGADLVVEFAPSIDLWLVDPNPGLGGFVDGYLLKVIFSAEGEIVTLFGCQREMNHILARGTLTESLLAGFVPHVERE